MRTNNGGAGSSGIHLCAGTGQSCASQDHMLISSISNSAHDNFILTWTHDIGAGKHEADGAAVHLLVHHKIGICSTKVSLNNHSIMQISLSNDNRFAVSFIKIRM